MNRAFDWLKQAQRDLEQAMDSHKTGRYEWACFAAQQAAEKAVKALHPEGAPYEHYGHIQGEEAIKYASEILEFVNSKMAKS